MGKIFTKQNKNNVNVKKIYKCNQCTRQFMNRHTLEFHFNVKHKHQSYHCDECSDSILEESFEDLYDYYQHSINDHNFPTTMKYMEIAV